MEFQVFSWSCVPVAVPGIPFPAGNAYSHLATQRMIAQGLGIAFSTSHTALANPQELRYLPIANECRPWVNRLYWRKHQTLTPDEEQFKTFVLNDYKR